ncbi:MAG: hypothetical protein LBJ01_07680 [Tannerella sp.]|nr:hypothetical protein [Tannerella sp.]
MICNVRMPTRQGRSACVFIAVCDSARTDDWRVSVRRISGARPIPAMRRR